MRITSKGEARGRSRHKNNMRIVRNLEERDVGTKGKSPKQDLTRTKDGKLEYNLLLSRTGECIVIKWLKCNTNDALMSKRERRVSVSQ